MIGQVVSHYRILERLGKGGMGEVYLAEDTNLGRRVAIKFPTLTSNERDFRARFLREARSISELSNPHIATLFDYGETSDGHPFLVMEFIQGRTLSRIMRKGEMTLPLALQVVEDVASALSEAHGRGIIHRDIKPQNIMVNDRGQVKVLDFGLAKQLNEDQITVSEPEAQTLLVMHTRSGALLGTPAYLSPEQAMGGNVDGRSDIFALGGVFYECVTGQPAFPGTNLIEIAANVIHVEPPPPSTVNPKLPPELDSVVLRALSKNVEKRYQSADELIADVRSVRSLLHDDSIHTLIQPRTTTTSPARNTTLTNLSQMLRRPRVPLWYVLVGVAAMLVATAIVWRWWRPPPHVPPVEARNWYEIGTNALRDGSFFQASKALESFETYCYHPFGKYAQIESLANLTKLRPLPNIVFAALLGSKSTEGKGYFVESDRGAGMYILLGLAKPDACSIYVQGVPYLQVKLRLESSYKLVFAGRDDMGQQLSEMYVPGGKTGDKKEAIELGLILVTYPKQELSADGFTLGYLPPGTVEGLFRR
jgi:serine/threonine protein kinase